MRSPPGRIEDWHRQVEERRTYPIAIFKALWSEHYPVLAKCLGGIHLFGDRLQQVCSTFSYVLDLKLFLSIMLKHAFPFNNRVAEKKEMD